MMGQACQSLGKGASEDANTLEDIVDSAATRQAAINFSRKFSPLSVFDWWRIGTPYI
jgi:hypothetical protein